MAKKNFLYLLTSIYFLASNLIIAQIYPDQFYELRIDAIKSKIESSNGIKISDDGKSIILQNNFLEGYFILSEQTSVQPFNQGLPSWNGKAAGSTGSFKVQMRFPYNNGWSPWLTIGYWQNNIWTDYGTTSYSGGYVDIDYVKLSSYVSKWQFKVILLRTDLSSPSPSIQKLSFFVSDSKTTSNVNINQIISDNPPAFFIPTTFVYQYGVDPVIGKDICSPSSVSMILMSYNIKVDPYQFALSTYDNYHKMFGVWPRVVQNAAEYGLDGSVTRYRSWSETKKVLDNGGRISMSVGLPISSAGHLLMLAGFTSDGRPIVHDSGKSGGQSYVYDKTTISQAWFAKGGIAYTFFNSGNIVSVDNTNGKSIPKNFELFQNYPNPFNPSTVISYQLTVSSLVTLKVYDMLGREVAILVDEYKTAGKYSSTFNAKDLQLTTGVYIYRLQAGSFSKSMKLTLLK
jgi:hypothetical protein